MKLLSKFLLIFMFQIPGIIQADMLGGDVVILTNIYNSMLNQIKIIKEELEELKKASDLAKQTTDVMSGLKHEYDFVKDFDFNSELHNIVAKFSDLIDFDEFSNINSPEEKLKLKWEKIKKRLESNKNGVEQRTEKELEDLKRRLKSTVVYEEMRNRFLQEVIDPTSVTDKDFQSRIASSTAILAAVVLEEQIKKKENDLVAREKLVDEMKWDADFINFLE